MTLRWEPDGAPRGDVALLHGVMALADVWWRIGPALAARGWRATAVDLPGHAGDVRRDGPLDLDALVGGVATAAAPSVASVKCTSPNVSGNWLNRKITAIQVGAIG